MSNVLIRIKESKFISGLLKNTNLQIGLLTFIILIEAIIITSKFIPAKNEPKKDPEIVSLEKSIKKARSITSPLAREAFIQDEARRLDKTSDEYRRLYILSKENLNSIPDAPKDPFYIIKWYYSDLNPDQRIQLLRNGIPWLINILSKSAIVLIAVRYILEIPEREKQAKYQAWQVIHSAYGQKSSGARIAALEDLLTQQESLSGLSLEEGANLKGVKLSGADLTVADLRSAILTNAFLANADLTGANLRGAILTYANLRGAILTYADLTVADLRGANLTNADLRGANLTNADLTGANLTNTNLTGANLRGANLRGAILRDADLTNAILTNADLTGANLRGAILTYVNLRGANLRDAILRDADLRDADLTVADLRGAILRGADLKGADLKDADLKGADLKDAILTYV